MLHLQSGPVHRASDAPELLPVTYGFGSLYGYVQQFILG
jgi:hypothetical protein